MTRRSLNNALENGYVKLTSLIAVVIFVVGFAVRENTHTLEIKYEIRTLQAQVRENRKLLTRLVKQSYSPKTWHRESMERWAADLRRLNLPRYSLIVPDPQDKRFDPRPN